MALEAIGTNEKGRGARVAASPATLLSSTTSYHPSFSACGCRGHRHTTLDFCAGRRACSSDLERPTGQRDRLGDNKEPGVARRVLIRCLEERLVQETGPARRRPRRGAPWHNGHCQGDAGACVPGVN